MNWTTPNEPLTANEYEKSLINICLKNGCDGDMIQDAIDNFELQELASKSSERA